jgi:hypothetical protein
MVQSRKEFVSTEENLKVKCLFCLTAEHAEVTERSYFNSLSAFSAISAVNSSTILYFDFFAGSQSNVREF